MDNLLTILCKGNITVKLGNKNQEREFRKICRDLQKKQGNVMLSRKDSTAFKDCINEKDPIYPLFYNFKEVEGVIYIGWSLYSNTFKNTLVINFKTFKQNAKGV